MTRYRVSITAPGIPLGQRLRLWVIALRLIWFDMHATPAQREAMYRRLEAGGARVIRGKINDQ
jgi:hypothetical protein